MRLEAREEAESMVEYVVGGVVRQNVRSALESEYYRSEIEGRAKELRRTEGQSRCKRLKRDDVP